MSAVAFGFFYFAMVTVAAVFSALGQGGGVLYTPLQLFFGIDFHTAATTSLFLIMITSLSATLVFRRAQMVDWALSFALESSTTLGAFLGGMFSGHFSGRFLTFLFAGVIALAALFMVKNFAPRSTCGGGRGGFFRWERHAGSETFCVNMGIALPISFVAGAISGLIGVAGGILKVPMMVLLFGVPMNVAVGSSAFMVGLTAGGGFSGHLIAGQFDWKVALALVPGIFLGGQVGARKSVKVDKARLKRFFGYFLLVLAVFLTLRAGWNGR